MARRPVSPPERGMAGVSVDARPEPGAARETARLPAGRKEEAADKRPDQRARQTDRDEKRRRLTGEVELHAVAGLARQPVYQLERDPHAAAGTE